MRHDDIFNPRLSRRRLLRNAGALLAAGGAAQAGLWGEASAKSPRPADTDLVSLVNPMQGTDSNFGFSRGSTLPLVCRPFGMTSWSPQNGTADGWFFNPSQHKIQGIRATHQPSPWMGDYGRFTIMAQAGEAVFGPEARATEYRPENLQVRPDYLSVLCLDAGVRIEMTATDRCSVFRFTFPSDGGGRVIMDALSQVEVDASQGVITGSSRHKSGGAPDKFACYFYAAFDRPFAKAFPLQDAAPAEGRTTAEGDKIGAVAEFGAAPNVVMRIGTSFISVEQARQNLQREVGGRELEAVRAEAARVWNETLGVVRVSGGTQDQRRTFYSCLYRAHLFPRMIHEFDDAGQPTHYSPYDGKIHPGVLYSDTGLWDGYHTVYPLLSLLQPARLGEMVQGFVNAYHEGGWLPQWPSPGYRGGMGGTHSDVVIVDAMAKGIPGFDREAAYAGMWKNATEPPGGFVTEGRPGLTEYLRLGYIPVGKSGSPVSNSLDFIYDDFCTAEAARLQGRTDDQHTLQTRALNYRLLFDPAVGYMRAKNADGTWQENFDEFAWGGPYTEGGPWQWTWAVPHDPAGLMTLMGGQEAFLRKLDRMLWQPPTFHTGGYGHEIHEMAEMAAIKFGQYAQGNQPVHQILPLFTAAGSPARMQFWSRRAITQLYSPEGFPGDEDNGEMSSWYVLSALGLFPHCPGRPSYVFASPLFPEAVISLANGKALTLQARDTSPENVYVNRVTLNGRTHTPLWISHADLMTGGRLEFAMGKRPVVQRLHPGDLPPSLSGYQNVAVQTEALPVRVSINCGGAGVGAFVGDCFFEGGEVVSLAAGETDMDRSARRGACTYRIPLPMPPNGHAYTVRLRFPVTDGEGQQNVRINHKTRLSRFTSRLESGTAQEFMGIVPDQEGAILVNSPPRRAALPRPPASAAFRSRPGSRASRRSG